MSIVIYNDFIEVPLWKVEGEGSLPKHSGSDIEEEDERQQVAGDVQAAGEVKDKLAPSVTRRLTNLQTI